MSHNTLTQEMKIALSNFPIDSVALLANSLKLMKLEQNAFPYDLLTELEICHTLFSFQQSESI